MTELMLDATSRAGKGKSVSRRLRREGQVPGVIYGVSEPVSVQCDALAVKHLIENQHGMGRLVTLKVDGAEKKVIVKDAQLYPVGHRVLHLDFHEIDVTKPVNVNVEVHPHGRAEGAKAGGILQTVTHEISIECLPHLIPEYLEVDITAMVIGDSIHVADLKLPEGVSALTNEDETLFVLSPPITEEAAALEEEEAAEEETAEVPTTRETAEEGEEE